MYVYNQMTFVPLLLTPTGSPKTLCSLFFKPYVLKEKVTIEDKQVHDSYIISICLTQLFNTAKK